MLKYWLFASLLLSSNGVFSQIFHRDTIKFSGVVLASDSLKALPNVHILTQKHTGTITNNQGAFALYVNKSDTLTFSYIGFKPYIYVVPDTLKINNFIAGIILNSDTIALSEVIVLPWMNKTQFKQSFISNQPDQYTINATRNLNLAGYTAKTSRQNWSPDEIINQQLKNYSQSVEYRGMINPSEQLNVIGLAQLLIFYTRQQLTQEEKTNRLKQELKKYIQETIPE